MFETFEVKGLYFIQKIIYEFLWAYVGVCGGNGKGIIIDS